MTSDKMITVGIATEEQLNQAFIDAWRRAEQGEGQMREEHLYVVPSKMFFHLLSPQRVKLLHTLRIRGKEQHN